MKKITLLFFIIFTFLFSTTSQGEWSYVVESLDGEQKYYYDKDRVRKSGKYLYSWELHDYIKPTKYGDLSMTLYVQLDCSILRYKYLKLISNNKSMGEGENTSNFTPPDEGKYPSPKSVVEVLYKNICEEQ